MATMASPLGGYEQIRGPFARALAKAERFFKAKLGIDAFTPVGRAPESKKFSFGAVLAVATGRNIAPNGMDDVRAVLNHMMGRDLFTGEIAAYDRDCRQILLGQIPQLRNVDLNSVTQENAHEVMRKAFGEQYPRTLEVLPLDSTQRALLENRVSRVAEYRQPAPLSAQPDSTPASFDQVKIFSDVRRLLAAGADVRPGPNGVSNPLTHVIFVLPLEERLFAVKDMLAKGADAVHNHAHGTKPAEMAAMMGDNLVLATLMDHGAKFGKGEFIAMVQGAQDRIERLRASSDRRDYGFVMSGMHACMREAFGRMEEGDVKQMLRDPEIQREMDRSPTLRGMIHSAQQVAFDPIERAKIGINLSAGPGAVNPGVGVTPLQVAAHNANPYAIGMLMDRGATFDKDAFLGVLQGVRQKMDSIRDSGGPADKWRAAADGVKGCLSEAFKRMGAQERETLLQHPDIQRTMRAAGADTVWAEARRAVDEARLSEAVAPRAKASGPSMG